MDKQFVPSIPGMFLQTDEIEEFKAEFQRSGVVGVANYLRKKDDEWKSIKLNVAITGNCGSGKSAFINASRGLKDYEEGAAEVGVTETTTDIKNYPHPKNPQLLFWDMPGVGTPSFNKENYSKEMGFDKFDFFIIMTCGRFTKNDLMLAEEIIAKEKKFFFVRSKIQFDVDNSKKSTGDENENSVLDKIRKDIQKNLGDLYQEKKVFLVDNREVLRYEFPKLQEQIIEDFPDLKREALLLSTTTFSVNMVKQKAEYLRSQIWKGCLLSAGIACIPLPGISVCADLAIIVAQSIFYFRQLGLNEESLQQTANFFSCDVEIFRNLVLKGNLVNFMCEEGLLNSVKEIPNIVNFTALEELTRLIPLIGPVISGSLSYLTIHRLMNTILSKMEETAVRVMEAVVEETYNLQEKK